LVCGLWGLWLMKGEDAVLGLAFAWCWALWADSFFVFERNSEIMLHYFL
jgi:hypothetical protein